MVSNTETGRRTVTDGGPVDEVPRCPRCGDSLPRSEYARTEKNGVLHLKCPACGREFPDPSRVETDGGTAADAPEPTSVRDRVMSALRGARVPVTRGDLMDHPEGVSIAYSGPSRERIVDALEESGLEPFDGTEICSGPDAADRVGVIHVRVEDDR